MLKLQIVSDLHLEFWDKKQKFNFIKPSAPILALLGDICCCSDDEDFAIFERFIKEILPLYELIIMISGNHEYYTNKKNNITYANTMHSIDDRIKLFFKSTSPKLHYLNNNTLKITANNQDYTIIGSTLWSWIPESERKTITESMNDYQYIQFYDNEKIRKLNANDVATLHLKNYRYIKMQINKAKKLNHKIIVLTHHKPYLSANYNSSSLDVAYESDLSDLFISPVLLWGYGHTHVADNSLQGASNSLQVTSNHKTILYSNPKGYPNQKTKFNKSAIITL